MPKKTIAGLIVSSLFCFTQSSFSQTMTMPADGGNGGLFNRIMNHPINIGQTFNKVMTTPITKTTVVEGAEDVAVYEETKSMGLVDLAVAGAATITIQQIMYHPDNVESFLESYPGMIPTIVNKVSPYPWGAGYLDGIGVGGNVYSEQEDLEKTKEWQDAQQAVLTQIVAVAQQRPKPWDCKNPQVVQQVLKDLVEPDYIFEKTATGQQVASLSLNQNLNTISAGGVSMFDVNSYYRLNLYSKKDDYIQNDHIPAKATIKQWYLTRHGITLTKSLYDNLIKNTTAISVSNQMHKDGRTWFGKNKSKVILGDASNLQLAVIKDLTNHYLYVQLSTVNPDPKFQQLNLSAFIASAILVYLRDDELCLFD